jgi:exodeoxyribonuclease VII small subunit
MKEQADLTSRFAQDLAFEQAFEQLEDVVGQLEAGNLPLERSLELYEQGVALVRWCQKKLDEAEQKVSQISGVGPEGPVLTPFVAEE